MKLANGLIIILLLFSPVAGWSATLQYALDIRVYPTDGKITAKARLSTDEDTTFRLTLPDLEKFRINGKVFNDGAGRRIALKVSPDREMLISFELSMKDPAGNLINEENVLLLKEWYPVPDVLAIYDFSVTLPRGFVAVAAADTISIDQKGNLRTFRFKFNHPLDILYLAASKDYVVETGRYRDVAIEAYFFREDSALAPSYIDHARKYLAMYEGLLTSYPYKRFAIVESIYPSGNAMPTFTLLGKDVVKLPFIVKTSLGHEILHQWFGNSVYIDFSHGNWSEGLTSYLADHWYASLNHRDMDYRKQIMIDYDAYVAPVNAIPIIALD